MYKVMIVDDVKYIRKSICNRISWEALGLSVAAEAGNGEEALEQMRTVYPDIVLVDIRMPLMDGLAFVAEAKKISPGCHYIIMSAYSDFSYAQKAIKLGVSDYILKPVEESELEALLGAIVHKKNEEKIMKQIQYADMEYDSEIPLTWESTAAIALYVETEEEPWTQIKSAADAVAVPERESVVLYSLKDYSRDHCFVYLLNGKYLTDDYIIAFTEKVQDAFERAGGIVSHSEIMKKMSLEKQSWKAFRF